MSVESHKQALDTIKTETSEYGHGFGSGVLSSRTTEEIYQDHANEVAFQASQNRSLIRRKPERYESQLVVNFLDEISDRAKQIGQLALIRVRSLEILERKSS